MSFIIILAFYSFIATFEVILLGTPCQLATSETNGIQVKISVSQSNFDFLNYDTHRSTEVLTNGEKEDLAKEKLVCNCLMPHA